MDRAKTFLLVVFIQILMLVILVFIGGPLLLDRLRPQLLQFMAAELSDTERAEIYDQIAESFGGAWDTVPEPQVGRLAKRNWSGTINQADVTINNAGLRDSRPFTKKQPDTARIICLGDSFVFGGGGREEDRFCNRLQDYYRARHLTLNGKQIETLAVGLGSWTLLQEATYLRTRLSEFDPDLIILLTVANDITESSGVTGAGVVTRDFSPESRAMGSGVFHNTVTELFGDIGYSAIQWDLSPASRRQWDTAMDALARLVELQQHRGGLVLLSTLDPPGEGSGPGAVYSELFRLHVGRQEIDAPVLTVTYLKDDPDMRLLHDSHPNRQGHELLAEQYILALHQLGWITAPSDEELPTLPKGVRVDLRRKSRQETIRTWNQHYIKEWIQGSIDFGDLEPEDSMSFLGGIFPETTGEALESYPWASVRSGFLMLRSKADEQVTVKVKVQVPSRDELFPFLLTMRLDGGPAAQLRLQSSSEAGIHTIESTVAGGNSRVVEICLETQSYFTGIADSRMKSFKLVEAIVE